MTNIHSIIQQTTKELIAECHDDWVGLWSVISALMNNGIEAKPLAMRKITMDVIRMLLNEKDIVAANFSKEDDYIHPWNLSPNKVIMRIEKEWDQLGREPNLGDIVYFTSKDLIVYQHKRVNGLIA